MPPQVTIINATGNDNITITGNATMTILPPSLNNASSDALVGQFSIPSIANSASTSVDTMLLEQHSSISVSTTLPGQHFHMDFGFVRGTGISTQSEDQQTVTSLDQYNSY